MEKKKKQSRNNNIESSAFLLSASVSLSVLVFCSVLFLSVTLCREGCEGRVRRGVRLVQGYFSKIYQPAGKKSGKATTPEREPVPHTTTQPFLLLLLPLGSASVWVQYAQLNRGLVSAHPSLCPSSLPALSPPPCLSVSVLDVIEEGVMSRQI